MDDNGGATNAGTIRLINGETGAQISMIAGDTSGDFLGMGGATALHDCNFVVISPMDDAGGIESFGDIRVGNGSTGRAFGLSMWSGEISDDLVYSKISESPRGEYLAIGCPRWDKGGLVDSGHVRLFLQ